MPSVISHLPQITGILSPVITLIMLPVGSLFSEKAMTSINIWSLGANFWTYLLCIPKISSEGLKNNGVKGLILNISFYTFY